MYTAINLAAFKIGWLSSVFGAAAGWTLIGPLAAIGAAGLHLVRSLQPRSELTLLICAAGLGIAFDGLLMASDWVSFPGHDGWLPPTWMVGIWVLFATTLNVAFPWLRNRLWLAALLGGVFGPLSYWSGSKAGALALLEPTSALVALSVGWALVMPLLIALGARLDGVSTPAANPALDGGQAHV